jgi:hypothetical protein
VTLCTAGTWVVTATDAGNGFSGAATITVNAGSAVAFEVMAPASAMRGTPFDVTILAVDGCGNIDTGYAGTIHFTSTDPNAVLPRDYTFQASDAGQHTFSGGVTLIMPGSQTLTVTDLGSGITGSAVIM